MPALWRENKPNSSGAADQKRGRAIIGSLEDFQYLLRRATDTGFAVCENDRALDKFRVVDHRLNKRIIAERRIGEIEVFIFRLALSHQIAGFHVEERQNLLEALCVRRGHEIFNNNRLDPLFLQEGERLAGFAAARIVVNFNRHCLKTPLIAGILSQSPASVQSRRERGGDSGQGAHCLHRVLAQSAMIAYVSAMTSPLLTRRDPGNSGMLPRLANKIGFVNWRGFLTLLWKEIHRFLKVPLQTIFAPMMTSVLFLAIFTLAFGGSGRYIGAVSFDVFLAPGLIMMAVIQNAFANTSSSILISKVQGNIVDILMPPLSPTELTLAYVLAGVARGACVALVVAVAVWPFVDLSVHSWPVIIYYVFAAGLMLSLLGIAAGIISDKFDHMAAVTNFIIMPLSFLSGTFYSIERLTGIWYQISHLNPFFYMIDGFRYGFIGTSDSVVWVGALLIAAVDIALYIFVWALIKSGYRLKA